jgi:hypothetical protein
MACSATRSFELALDASEFASEGTFWLALAAMVRLAFPLETRTPPMMTEAPATTAMDLASQMRGDLRLLGRDMGSAGSSRDVGSM